jgi:Mn-dependent DtxR family transcriptional regulator
VSAEEFATLGINRVYRSVYNMTDGAKSVEDIALLLKKPVETIWNVLSILQERGMIQITPYRRGSNTSSP